MDAALLAASVSRHRVVAVAVLLAIALALPSEGQSLAWGPANITTVHVVQGCHLDVVSKVKF